MASPPPKFPNFRHIRAPIKKVARWVRNRFSSSPSSSQRSPTPTGSITATKSQVPPGLSTSVGGSVQPGFSNNSTPLGPSISDKRSDRTITAAKSKVPSGLLTSVGGSAQPGVSNNSAPLEPSISEKRKDRLGAVWNGLQTTLGVLKESSDAFPPLKSAVGGLVACLKVVQTAAGNREDYKELASELENTVITLEPYVKKLAAEGVVDGFPAFQRILKLINEEVSQIKQIQDHGRIRQIFEAPQDQGDLIKRYRRIDSLFRQLYNDINLRTWDVIKRDREMILLERLFPVKSARYNSQYSTNAGRRQCTPETRKDILTELKAWARDANGAKVYWMNGMAGTGKTTIMYSLCKWLEENEQLSGNFFCSRNGSEQDRDANNIVSTIAYQMAQYSSPIRSALCRALEKDLDASSKNINAQFKTLVQQPMQEVKATIPGGVVIVVDALDECSNPSTVRLFLKTLLEHAVTLPMKFIVASRPEYAIRDEIQISGYTPSVFYLHNIDGLTIAADIKRFLVEALGSIIPTSDLERLTIRAGKLFIYAATAVRYIHPENFRVNSSARLQALLNVVTESTKQHAELDGIYKMVLFAALNHNERDQKDVRNTQLVLWTVVCAMEPISAQTLKLLLGLTEEEVRNSLEPLQSILHVLEQGGTGWVSVFHASFPEFMFDYDRSGDLFYCNLVEHSKVIANGCLDLMKKDLRFNISKPVSSYEGALAVEAGGKDFTTATAYAWRYWGEHLRQGGSTCTSRQELNDYLGRQLGLSSGTMP